MHFVIGCFVICFLNKKTPYHEMNECYEIQIIKAKKKKNKKKNKKKKNKTKQNKKTKTKEEWSQRI